MAWWNEFWADESGALISAELATVATVGVVGATVGWNMTAKAVNSELQEISYAIRSLDQSYSYSGHKGCHAWTAGSNYTQPDVRQSLADLCGPIHEMKPGAEVKKEDVKQPKKVEVKKSMEDPKKPSSEPKKKQKKKISKKKVDDDQDELEPTENTITIQEVDDESLTETVLEPTVEEETL